MTWKVIRSHEDDTGHVHDPSDEENTIYSEDETPKDALNLNERVQLALLDPPFSKADGPHTHNGITSPIHVLRHAIHQHGKSEFSDELDLMERMSNQPLNTLPEHLTLADIFKIHNDLDWSHRMWHESEGGKNKK